MFYNMFSKIDVFNRSINSNHLSAVSKGHASTKYQDKEKHKTENLLNKICKIALSFQPAAVNDNIFKMIAEVSGRPTTEEQRRCLILACENIASLSYTQSSETELKIF